MDTANVNTGFARSPSQGLGRWAVTGIVWGVVAGIVFAMFEMIMAAILGQGFFMPLRMIGAIILGQGALMPTYSLAGAAVVGIILHMMLAAMYGLVFGVVVGAVAALRSSRVTLVVAATVYGFALWIFNFYVVTAVAFDWFKMANTTVQFFAHTFFFGTMLGLLFAARSSLVSQS